MNATAIEVRRRSADARRGWFDVTVQVGPKTYYYVSVYVSEGISPHALRVIKDGAYRATPVREKGIGRVVATVAEAAIELAPERARKERGG